MDKKITLYRYEDVDYYIKLREFIVIKETPCGYWINTTPVNFFSSKYRKKKWVMKGARKSFAYPTKELALNSFKHRKIHHIELLKHKLENLQRIIPKINQLAEKEGYDIIKTNSINIIWE